MSTLLTGLLLCSGLGCTPATDPGPGPDLTITTAGECARISFQITGPTSVTTWYPSASCTVGLVVITSGGASTWDGATRTLTLRLRVVNTSGQPVTLPVRLELPVAGKTVTVPEGMAGDSLVPLNMDSTLAGDRKLWLVWGGTGTLAPGDSSETRWVTVEVKAPVTKGRLWFVSSGEEIPTVPAVAPDSIPGWLAHDSTFVGSIAKNALLVEFLPNATVAQKAAAFDSVGAITVGGKQYIGGTDGPYIVWLPVGDLDALMAQIPVLERQPQVRRVTVIARARDFGRRPSDDGSWHRDSWQLIPDSASGGNWALEELAAPLAWGCSVGDTATAVAVVDHGFVPDDYTPNLVGPLPGLSATNHGRLVANVLAARGNNDVGMAGMMWYGRVRAYDRVAATGASQTELADAILRAVQGGARVITVTAGATFELDIVKQRRAAFAFGTEIAAVLRRWSSAGHPGAPGLRSRAAGRRRRAR